MKENKKIKKELLSAQPYKGSRDFYPEDMAVQNYIFETWKKVCKKYGYEEYGGPFLETFELYAAKSGDELVNEQLYSFEDRGGRKVAIRPEMTPTLARMVAQKYKELNKPLRWFSIPNLWRYEQPQKGRLREFFQLNIDIFGAQDVYADFEIILIAINIMKEFGADKNMVKVRVNSRKFMDEVYDAIGLTSIQRQKTTKLLDKRYKLSKENFIESLNDGCELNFEQASYIENLLENPLGILAKLAQESYSAKELLELLSLAEEAGVSEFIEIDPSIVRGLAYYTGIVFEMFDLNPENPRALFGGGRYDNLLSIFNSDPITGTGMGMGDVTLRIFLESRNLLPNTQPEIDFLVATWPDAESIQTLKNSIKIAKQIIESGYSCQIYPDRNSKIEKQIKYAIKAGVKKVVVIGEEEARDGTVTVKDLAKQTQETLSVDEFLLKLAKS